MCFDGNERNYQQWEIKFLAHMKMQKLKETSSRGRRRNRWRKEWRSLCRISQTAQWQKLVFDNARCCRWWKTSSTEIATTLHSSVSLKKDKRGNVGQLGRWGNVGNVAWNVCKMWLWREGLHLKKQNKGGVVLGGLGRRQTEQEVTFDMTDLQDWRSSGWAQENGENVTPEKRIYVNT